MNLLFSRYTFYLIFVLTSIVGFSYIQYQKREIQRLKTEELVKEQNIFALSDSLRITKDAYGNSVYQIGVLVTTVEELKKTNSELFEIYKTIPEAKSIIEIKSLISKTKKDTIWNTIYLNLDTSEYTHRIPYSFTKKYNTDNFYFLSGNTQVKVRDGGILSSMTSLDSFSVGFNLTTGIKEVPGKPDFLEIWVKSNNPDLVPQKVSGTLVRKSDFFGPKKEESRKFPIVLGVGISTGIGTTDFKTYRPMVVGGLSLSYPIRFKK